MLPAGGLALLAHEAREEQDGTVTRPLPVATDPRFVVEPAKDEAPENDAENAATGDGADAVAQDTTQQEENAAAAPETPASEETKDEPEND